MHFSSASAATGDQAFLESRWLYPKPGAQCLQFFLYNSGAVDDVLNILVRDSDGKLTLIKSISGSGLNVTFCFWPSGWTHFLRTSKLLINKWLMSILCWRYRRRHGLLGTAQRQSGCDEEGPRGVWGREGKESIHRRFLPGRHQRVVHEVSAAHLAHPQHHRPDGHHTCGEENLQPSLPVTGRLLLPGRGLHTSNTNTPAYKHAFHF